MSGDGPTSAEISICGLRFRLLRATYAWIFSNNVAHQATVPGCAEAVVENQTLMNEIWDFNDPPPASFYGIPPTCPNGKPCEANGQSAPDLMSESVRGRTVMMAPGKLVPRRYVPRRVSGQPQPQLG